MLKAMWLYFALLAGGIYTVESLVARHTLRNQKDSAAFSIAYSLVGTVISLPFMLAASRVPHSVSLWLLAIAIGFIIVIHNFLVFRASGLLEASLLGAVSKLRLVWVFIFGIVFLSVSFSWAKLFGTLLVIAAGLIVVRRFRKPESKSGISLALTATLFNASVIILSKYLLGSFNAVSLTFFASFLPALIFNLILIPHSVTRLRKLLKNHWRPVLLACGLGAFANLALNQALALHDANSVIILNEAFLVLVLVGEHLVFKEKQHLWFKLASIVLAIAGAILIQIR